MKGSKVGLVLAGEGMGQVCPFGCRTRILGSILIKEETQGK